MVFRFVTALVLSIVCLTSFACGTRPPLDASETNRAEQEATAKELRKLAEEGNLTAQNRLGLAYKFGRGVSQNYGQAKRWFEEAAKQGHAGAQINLGMLYLREDAPPRSPQMAIFWFSRAAEQGVVPAFTKLGQMYQEAEGVPEDLVQAYMWFHLAATNGEAPSAEKRDVLATKMTYAQIMEAKQRAQEWKPTRKSVPFKLRTASSGTPPESKTTD
jgi:TPR repeat protein